MAATRGLGYVFVFCAEHLQRRSDVPGEKAAQQSPGVLGCVILSL